MYNKTLSSNIIGNVYGFFSIGPFHSCCLNCFSFWDRWYLTVRAKRKQWNSWMLVSCIIHYVTIWKYLHSGEIVCKSNVFPYTRFCVHVPQMFLFSLLESTGLSFRRLVLTVNFNRLNVICETERNRDKERQRETETKRDRDRDKERPIEIERVRDRKREP